MKYSFSSLATIIGLASAAAVDKHASSPLSVNIEPMGETVVRATITNNGEKDYNIMQKGTILDTAPVNKFAVTKGGKYTRAQPSPLARLPLSRPSETCVRKKLTTRYTDTKADFHGVKLRLATTNVPESSFIALGAGSSTEVVVDLAEIYGLDNSGTYDVQAAGQFRYAEKGSTELVGEPLRFSSNKVSIDVDGAKAASVTKAIDGGRQRKRSTISSDCSADQRSVIDEGIDRCYSQATAAARAARSGSASKFREYFMSTSSDDRSYVASRFDAVASECRNTPGGVLDVHCDDIYNYCERGTFAYTIPSESDVIWCDAYWSAPLETSQCHGDDKTGTTIHEFTHADEVFSPGTDDFAYGYPACSRLSRSEALENADTYEYYANGEFLILLRKESVCWTRILDANDFWQLSTLAAKLVEGVMVL